MKPDNNLINIIPVSQMQNRTEAVSCPTRKCLAILTEQLWRSPILPSSPNTGQISISQEHAQSVQWFREQ